MSKTISVEVQDRCPISGSSSDYRTLAKIVDDALKMERFCEQERAIIVEIVCNALLGPLTPQDK